MKAGRTSLEAKLWSRSASDSVDAVVEALVGNRPVKVALQQGVGDGSNHLLGATLLRRRVHHQVHGPVLGLNHGYAEKEEGFAKPRQIGEKHLLVQLTAIAGDPLCCSGAF